MRFSILPQLITRTTFIDKEGQTGSEKGLQISINPKADIILDTFTGAMTSPRKASKSTHGTRLEDEIHDISTTTREKSGEVKSNQNK